MKHAMKNILIVDNDLRFIQWLGRALIGAHQQPLPACNVSDAMVLVDDSAEPVDLLIINSYLPHSSDLIDRLHRSQSHLKVLAMGSEPNAKLPHVHAWKRKRISSSLWKTVRRFFAGEAGDPTGNFFGRKWNCTSRKFRGSDD